MFETLTESFTSALRKIRFHDDEKALVKALGELKKALLKADVNHKVVKTLIEEVEEIWSAIDQRDDWQPLHDKVNRIRRMGDAHGAAPEPAGIC